MAYQVLARKWRPQTFSGIIGQEPVVTALRNALTDGRIAQAYLFSGIRGVGKTTAARVLAKALNCERGPDADPCNECVACREITRGADLDVIEVDAATYSKVEQVRELTESLKYSPARDRYKVVVLDEIHRLSRQAFDALLKIVEEPPPHLVFVFATTEIETVPATILSRCQEFRFRRVPSEILTRHLREICGAEEITASDRALRLVARAGEGSVRDAVALLDQLATFGGGEVSDEEAVRLLGGLDTALFAEVLAAIVDGEAEGVRRAVARIEDEGWDPRNVYAQFLAYCRDALHLAMGEQEERIDLPAEEAAALGELARGAGYEALLRLVQSLLAGEATVRRSELGALAVEIAWLKAAELPKLTRVEEILSGARELPAPVARVPASPAGDAAPAASPVAAPTPPAAGNAGPRTAHSFIEEVRRLKQPLGALLDERLLELDGQELVIRIPAGDELLRHRLGREVNRRILDQAVRAAFGDGASWRSVDGIAPVEEPPRRPAPTSGEGEAADDVASEQAVQAVLDLFDGRIEAVEHQSTVREE